MSNKIQIKRGEATDLPVLDVGEPGFCTDLKKVYIGDGSSNLGIITNNIFDANTILVATSDDSPVALPVSSQTVVGRQGGNIVALPLGISDNNIIEVDGSIVAADFAKFTSNGLEGRSAAEVIADLSSQAGADFSLNNQKITSLGTPTADNDAVNKAYADSLLENICYGVSWDESQASGGYTRTRDLVGQSVGQTLSNNLLPIQAAMKRCILNDTGVVQYYLDASDSTKKADGSASDLTGADGQVMVEIPAFYYKYSYSGTIHTWEISNQPISGFSLHPAFIKNEVNVDYRYIGAYEGIGYDDSTSTYFDGDDASNTGTQWPGSTSIDISNDMLGSVSGYAPLMNETRAEFRSICSNRGVGWRNQDYDLISAIQLLYIIEYADWNSQSMIGKGRVERATGTWAKDSYIGVTGKSNSNGNATASVESITNSAYMSYRGIENFYGNVWKWIDGININSNAPYVCNNDVNFIDDVVTNYTNLNITLSNSDGYQETLEQISRGFLPSTVGGASNTYITDYYHQNSGWQVAAFGGCADIELYAGITYWHFSLLSTDNYINIGGRLCR